MGKFLGIHYDYWHGILAFFGVIVFGILSQIISGIENPAARVITSLIQGFALTLMLQGVNEAWQGRNASDPAALRNWQINTRKDWKWFFYGGFAGLFVAALMIVLLLN